MKYTQKQINDALYYRTGTSTFWDDNNGWWMNKTEEEMALTEELALILPNVGNDLYYDGLFYGYRLQITGMSNTYIIAKSWALPLTVTVPLTTLNMSYDDKGAMHYYARIGDPGLIVS